ncbi:MAG TPA: hypothetical protein DCZ72_02235 [Armatimonadetes bacterium]|nr:hypothetical protein [Armatimonadota bacterium]
MPKTTTPPKQADRPWLRRPLQEEELRQHIREQFADGRFVKRDAAPGRLVGEIVSSEFTGMPIEDRIRLVRERVYRYYGRHGLNIGILLPCSPDEVTGNGSQDE